MRGEALRQVYDVLEWLILREISVYGKHINAGKERIRPGDDFYDLPVEIEQSNMGELFINMDYSNFVVSYGINTAQTSLKLPKGTKISLRQLPKQDGVLRYGTYPVRSIVIRNPAGQMTITPSQLWREARGKQAGRILEKQIGQDHATLYYWEACLLIEIRFRQSTFVTPFPRHQIPGYQRWLLELQEQMIRHMDWRRFVEADYRRALVDLRDSPISETVKE